MPLVKMTELFATHEAEIGRVGGAEGDYKSVDVMVTSVEEAERFATETGVDALAVAIGTAHGNYTVQPKLRIDRLREIFDAIEIPPQNFSTSATLQSAALARTSRGTSKFSIPKGVFHDDNFARGSKLTRRPTRKPRAQHPNQSPRE